MFNFFQTFSLKINLSIDFNTAWSTFGNCQKVFEFLYCL